MNSSLNSLAADNINIPKPSTKSRIRENTALFNMLLKSGVEDKFNDPFGACHKTLSRYTASAKTLKKIGVASVHNYDTKLIKKTCELIDSIEPNFLPRDRVSSITSDDDFYTLITDLKAIKITLKSFQITSEMRILLTEKLLSLSQIIHITNQFIQIHKLIRSENETFEKSIVKYTTLSFIEVYKRSLQELNAHAHCEHEGGVNRKEIYSIRAFIHTLVTIQVSILSNDDPDLNSIILGDIKWLDRLLSTVLSL